MYRVRPDPTALTTEEFDVDLPEATEVPTIPLALCSLALFVTLYPKHAWLITDHDDTIICRLEL